MASNPVPRFSPRVPQFQASVVRDRPGITRAREFLETSRARETGFRPAEDLFDAHGEIIAVTDSENGDLVASCRLLSPADAHRAGGNDIDRRFDTALLIVLRERMVEVDTPCVHPLYRPESVLTHLWSALARYLIANRHDFIVGTARVATLDGGHTAASIHRLACSRFLSPDDLRVYPRRRLALDGLSDTRNAVLPHLLKSYIDAGAWICGEPAERPALAAAEFPMLLALARMQGRDARHFLSRAS